MNPISSDIAINKNMALRIWAKSRWECGYSITCRRGHIVELWRKDDAFRWVYLCDDPSVLGSPLMGINGGVILDNYNPSEYIKIR